jgi:hypothetical protein
VDGVSAVDGSEVAHWGLRCSRAGPYLLMGFVEELSQAQRRWRAWVPRGMAARESEAATSEPPPDPGSADPEARNLVLCKQPHEPPSSRWCRRQKRVGRWLLGFSFRFTRDQCRSLSFFSYTGKHTKPIRLPSKGCSGLRWKASVRCCLVVSRSDLGVLFCLKRHPDRMSLDL